MSIQEAVEAPRLSLFANPSFYRPGADILIRVENRVAPGVVDSLRAKAHRAEPTGGYTLGSIQGVLMNLVTETMAAGADPRRAAYAVGW